MFILDTAELRTYIGINADFDINILKPHLEWAEENYLPDLLGDDLYNVFVQIYINGYSENTIQRKPWLSYILLKINSVVAHIAMFDWLSVAGVNISDNGLHRIEGEIAGLARKTAYQYQERDAKDFYRRKGFNMMDSVLRYIMGNISKFDEFKTSDSYKSLTGDYFPDLRCFEKHFNIGKSLLLFMKLKAFIREAELFDLTPAIGKTLDSEIKSHVNFTQGVYVEIVIPMVRNVLAYYAIARGIESCSINFIEDGARLIIKDSTNGNFEKTTKPDLTGYIEQTKCSAENYLALLCSYFRDNIDQFPSYVDNRSTPIDNTDRKFVTVF